MAGINLSQSIKEKQAIARGSFFDRSFFINTVVFLIVLGLYAGTSWYLGTFETELQALQANFVEQRTSLKSPEADAIADIALRSDTMARYRATNPDPSASFGELEQLTLPEIRVIEYSRQQTENTIVIRGKTVNLKFLAQQMLLYQKATSVMSVHVEQVKYLEAGGIEFTLHIPMIVTVPEPTS